MIFTCDVSALSEAILSVSHAIMAKSNVAALEGILIETAEGGVRLSGYNLELGITTVIDANVAEEGRAVFSARLFGEIIRKLPETSVKISVDDKLAVSIVSGAAVFDIIAISADEYPELPSVISEKSVSIGESVIKSMIRQTIFAVSTDETRPVHTGIKFDIADGKINLAAINGVCLAVRTENIESDENLSFVVPGKTMNVLLKLLGDGEEMIKISIGKRQIIFSIGGYNIYSRLLDGQFIDYASTIPKEGKTEVYLPTRSLMQCVERASLIISERVKSPVRFNFEDGVIKINCLTILGKSYNEIEVNMSGENIEIGFNDRYLLETLKAVETDYIRIILSGSYAPMKILPAEGEGFVFLVLPVRLK